jgi:hypothetical protein
MRMGKPDRGPVECQSVLCKVRGVGKMGMECKRIFYVGEDAGKRRKGRFPPFRLGIEGSLAFIHCPPASSFAENLAAVPSRAGQWRTSTSFCSALDGSDRGSPTRGEPGPWPRPPPCPGSLTLALSSALPGELDPVPGGRPPGGSRLPETFRKGCLLSATLDNCDYQEWERGLKSLEKPPSASKRTGKKYSMVLS